MLVKRYRCQRRLPGPYSAETVPCYNEFWGPECRESIEEITCPFCGKKGTLVMYKREWQIAPDTVLTGNAKIDVNLVEKPPELVPT